MTYFSFGRWQPTRVAPSLLVFDRIPASISPDNYEIKYFPNEDKLTITAEETPFDVLGDKYFKEVALPANARPVRAWVCTRNEQLTLNIELNYLFDFTEGHEVELTTVT